TTLVMVVLKRPIQPMQGNKTTEPSSDARGQQSAFGRDVVVRRRDVGNVRKIDPALIILSRHIKIVLPGSKIIRSTRVHCWTPHKTHRPHTILLPLNSDFWEGELPRQEQRDQSETMFGAPDEDRSSAGVLGQLTKRSKCGKERMPRDRLGPLKPWNA